MKSRKRAECFLAIAMIVLLMLQNLSVSSFGAVSAGERDVQGSTEMEESNVPLVTEEPPATEAPSVTAALPVTEAPSVTEIPATEVSPTTETPPATEAPLITEAPTTALPSITAAVPFTEPEIPVTEAQTAASTEAVDFSAEQTSVTADLEAETAAKEENAEQTGMAVEPDRITEPEAVTEPEAITEPDTVEESDITEALESQVQRMDALPSMELKNIAVNGTLQIALTDNSQNVTDEGVIVGRKDTMKLSISYEIANTWKQQMDENTIITYQLPEALKNFQDITNGIIYEGNEEIGQYSVKNNGLTWHYNQAFLDQHSDVSGTFELSVQLNVEYLTSSNEVILQFDGTGSAITIQIKSETITGTKTLVNCTNDGENPTRCYFKITLKPDGTATNVKLTDTLGADFEADLSSFQINGTPITPIADSTKQVVKLDLGTLEGNRDYVITYQANLVGTAKDGTANKNVVEWIWGAGSKGTASYTWNFSTGNPIKKTGSLQKDGSILWVITVNADDARKNMDGVTIIDERIDSNQKFMNEFEIYRRKAGEAYTKVAASDVTASCVVREGMLQVVFHQNAGFYTYQIRLKSKPTISAGQIGDVIVYKNKATVKWRDQTEASAQTSVTDQKSVAPGVLTKVLTESNSTTFEAVWKSTIDLSQFGSEGVSNLIFSDAVKDGWLNSLAVGTAIKEDSLVVKDVTNNRTLTSPADYTVRFLDGSSSAELAGNNTIEISFTGIRSGLYTVEYRTVSEGEKLTDVCNTVTIKNQAKVKYTYRNASWQDESSAEWKITKETTAPPFDKTMLTAVWDENEKTYFLDCTLLANAQFNYDKDGIFDLSHATLTMEDQTPAHTSYVPGSGTLLIRNTGTDWNNVTSQEPLVSGQKLTWTISNPGKSLVLVSYRLKVDPGILSNADENGTISFTNQALLYQDGSKVGEDSETRVIQVRYLEKTSAENGMFVKYTIQVNRMGTKLSSDGRLVLQDTMTGSADLVPSSIQVLKGETLTPLEAGSFSVRYDSDSRSMELVLPDEQFLTIVYKVRPTGMVGESVKLQNKAVLTGKTMVTVSDEKSWRVQSSSATATGSDGTLIIKKINQDAVSETLAGATFALYRVDSLDAQTVTLVDTQISGEAGTLTFQKDGAGKLQKDILYYYEETKAPAGFDGSSTKHYFILQGNDYEQVKNQLRETHPELEFSTYEGGVTVEVTNARQTGSLVIRKMFYGGNLTDEQKNKVTFTLNGPNDNSWNFHYSDFTSGEMRLTGLEPGTYTLTESNAGVEGCKLEVSYNVYALLEPEGKSLLKNSVQSLGETTGTVENPDLAGGDWILPELELNADQRSYVIEIRNTYTEYGFYVPQIQKQLQGAGAEDWNEVFQFLLQELPEKESNIPIEANRLTAPDQKSISGSGTVSFDPILYTAPGIYVYEIRELAGSSPSILYDSESITLTVEVRENEETHKLEVAVASYLKGEMKPEEQTESNLFMNKIISPAKFQPMAHKTLTGRELEANQFTFVLLENGDEYDRAENAADGRILFNEIWYEEPGTHSYEVRELAEEGNEWCEFDQTVYTIEVQIFPDPQNPQQLTYSSRILQGIDQIQVSEIEFVNQIVETTPEERTTEERTTEERTTEERTTEERTTEEQTTEEQTTEAQTTEEQTTEEQTTEAQTTEEITTEEQTTEEQTTEAQTTEEQTTEEITTEEQTTEEQTTEEQTTEERTTETQTTEAQTTKESMTETMVSASTTAPTTTTATTTTAAASQETVTASAAITTAVMETMAYSAEKAKENSPVMILGILDNRILLGGVLLGLGVLVIAVTGIYVIWRKKQ